MNWRQGRPYGQELWDKMFAAIDAGMAAEAVAAAFWVMCRGSTRRWGGGARPVRRRHVRRGCHAPGKLDAYHADISTQVAAKPDITIGELQSWMRDTHGVSFNYAVMWEKLQELNLTLKNPGMQPSRRVRMSRRHTRNGVLCKRRRVGFRVAGVPEVEPPRRRSGKRVWGASEVPRPRATAAQFAT
jgi:transposase